VLDQLRRAGGLSHHFAAFESRPEQETMAVSDVQNLLRASR